MAFIWKKVRDIGGIKQALRTVVKFVLFCLFFLILLIIFSFACSE